VSITNARLGVIVVLIFYFFRKEDPIMEERYFVMNYTKTRTLASNVDALVECLASLEFEESEKHISMVIEDIRAELQGAVMLTRFFGSMEAED